MVISGGALVLADATPITFQSSYYPSTGLNLTALFASYGAIYKQQLWVRVLVRKRALATRRLPMKVYERGDEGRVEARDSAYSRLLRRPNQRMSGGFLWEWTSSTYDIYGEAIWLKVRGRDGVPVEVWPVHPSNVEVKKNDDGSLSYIYAPGLGSHAQFVIPEKDVVHFKSYNPDSTTRGLSPLEALRQTLVNEDAARRATSSFWQKGARPGFALQHPGQLSEQAQKRLKAQWEAIAGGVDNTGTTVVLEEGMQANPITLSAEEAQYIETRKLNREEACAVYDVPPPVVHILDRATFSNITEQMRSMYRDTMAPHLGSMEDALVFQLQPEFEDNLYAEFLMDEVLRGTFEERAQQMQAAINSGQLTPNEARALDNRAGLPGGDRLFINSTMVPLETAGAALPPQTVQIAARALDTVMGRLGSCSTLDDVEPGVLTAGLNGHADIVCSLLEDARANGDSITEFRAQVRAALT